MDTMFLCKVSFHAMSNGETDTVFVRINAGSLLKAGVTNIRINARVSN